MKKKTHTDTTDAQDTYVPPYAGNGYWFGETQEQPEQPENTVITFKFFAFYVSCLYFFFWCVFCAKKKTET